MYSGKPNSNFLQWSEENADYANDLDSMTATTSTYKPCKHENGWYFSVKFWIFRARLFWCDDCNEAIPIKELKINSSN